MTRGVLARACALMAALLWLALGGVASAQAPRTWVSELGDDNNPCSRTLPCKTFAGAVTRTAAGGEISVLDPGGYGAVTISQSISIVAEGLEGSVLVGNGNGIVINAGPTDVVTLSGLTFEGMGPGFVGIKINSAGTVIIRKCLIKSFQAVGATGVVAGGIVIDGDPKTPIFVSDCTIADNTAGIILNAGQLFLDRVQLVRNMQSGVRADGAQATVQINNSTVAYNKGAGLDATNGGKIYSFHNNALYGNSPDGKPTKFLPPF